LLVVGLIPTPDLRLPTSDFSTHLTGLELALSL
jgi:hypothetical protein